MTAPWWAAAALFAPATPAAAVPSLAAWHGSWIGEGEAFSSDSVLQPDGSWRVFAMLQYRHKTAEE